MFEGTLSKPNTLLTTRLLLATGSAALAGVFLAGCGNHHAAAQEGRNYTEVEQFGANTFHDYQHASDLGPHLAIGQKVKVDCVAHGPVAAAPSANGEWYHITAPSNYHDLYAATNTFENGDTSGPVAGQPRVDSKVPSC